MNIIYLLSALILLIVLYAAKTQKPKNKKVAAEDMRRGFKINLK